MEKFVENIIKACRRLHDLCPIGFSIPDSSVVIDTDSASRMLLEILEDDKPCMVARYGSTELLNIVNYIGVKKRCHNVWDVITRKSPQWWWNKISVEQLKVNSGFFPITKDKVVEFCEMMLNDSHEIDILARWRPDEYYMAGYLKDDVKSIHLFALEPWWANKPWTKALKGKKVLVVHPFARLITQQYSGKRPLLFDNKDVLPEFHLETVQAVQSLGGDNSDFSDWFEALQWMKDEIDKHDYDICLIGCGAYGMPLAAHCKRKGKKAVHMGGALQLLFGIKGNRWEDPMYGVKEWGLAEGQYVKLFNEHWIKPDNSVKPKSADKVEGSCYW